MKIEISSLQGVLAAVYSGLFEMTIPFICFGMALKTNNPALINHLCYLSPFLSLFIIHVIWAKAFIPQPIQALHSLWADSFSMNISGLVIELSETVFAFYCHRYMCTTKVNAETKSTLGKIIMLLCVVLKLKRKCFDILIYLCNIDSRDKNG